MTALASTDVTITLPAGKRDIIPAGPKLVSIATVAFGDGSLTYPTGGVPMPAIGKFGFRKELQFVAIEPAPANGFFYKFDRANHKILIYTQGMRTGSTAADACGNGALAEDSAAAETVVRLSGTAIDTTYDFGPLREMGAAIAPAAVTLVLLMVGE